MAGVISPWEDVNLRDLETGLPGCESHPCHLQAVLLEQVTSFFLASVSPFEMRGSLQSLRQRAVARIQRVHGKAE